MSKLVEHAKRELALLYPANENNDYGELLPKAILNAVEVWAAEGHSGFSHALALRIFNEVINFRPLTPLTDDPSLWEHAGEGMWQSQRQSSAFSHDQGKTYYLIEDIMDTFACTECSVSYTSRHNPERRDHIESCAVCDKGMIRRTKGGKTIQDAIRQTVRIRGYMDTHK